MGRKLARLTLATLLALLAAIAGTAAWLLGTESGLTQLLALAARAPAVAIVAHGVRGTLVGGFEIDELVVDHERVRVVARGLRARLGPLGLPVLRLRLTSLAARDVAIAVKPAVRPPDGAPVAFMPGPWRLAVDQVAVAALAIRAPAGGELRLAEVAARVELARSRIVAPRLHARGGGYVVDGRATLSAGDPLGLAADLAFTANVGARRLSGRVAAAGTLAALSVTAATSAPRGASFAGSLGLSGAPQIDGRLTFDRMDPDALGLASGAIAGTLDVRGSVERFTMAGRLAASGLPLGPVAVTVAGGYEGESLTLTQLAASAATTAGGAPAKVLVAGRIGLGAHPRIELRGDWTGLRWPIGARGAPLTSPSGTFRIAGGGPFEYEVRAALAGAPLPAATLAAQGTVDGARLAVASFEATLAGGRATGRAALGFTGPRPWSVAVSGRGLDPGAFRALLKGRVNFDLQAEGEGFDPLGHWDARLERLDGSVRGLAAHGGGAITVRGGQLQVDHVRLAFGSAQLDADGAVGAGSGLRWRLNVDRLGDFLDAATGSIRSHGVLSGDAAHRAAEATLEASDLGYAGWSAAQVTAEAEFDATDRRPSFLRLTARGVGHGASRAEQLRLTLEGTASAHALGLRLVSGADSGELAAHGAYRDGVWTLRLESLRGSGQPLLSYRLAEPSTLVLARDAASLTPTCIVREESSLCARGTWSSTRPWEASLDATALPLRLRGVGLARDMEYGDRLSAHLTGRGAPGQAWTGEGVVELAGTELRYRASNGRMEQVRLERGRARVQAEPGSYGGDVEAATAAGSSVAASARLRRDDGPLARAPLSGAFSMSTTELGALPALLPGVDRVAGRLEAALKLSGTLAAPVLSGSVHLTDGELDVQRTNLLLRSVDAQLAIDGDTVALSASATTRGGSASAGGHLRWHDRVAVGELDFKGERLLVADLPEARIVASPQLHFAVDRNRIAVRGEVGIPSAHLAPRDLRSAVIASGDERLVSEEAAPAQGTLAVDATVRLVLGDDVTIDAYGLKGKLGGSLLVTARDGEAPYGSGELNLRDGKYTAYSREFDIDRGRLLFAGQSLGNPGIDVRAQRKIDTSVAGINVRGTLLKPQMSFYSDPPMSQSQIAAMLILGTTLDDVQSPAKTPTSGTDTRGVSSVVIGRFLTPRLYVSYGVSLTEAINTLKLRYTIGDRWVLRTESGVQQSIDIEYTIGR